MYLCFDVGNTHIHGGFYLNDQSFLSLRINTNISWSSDQFGIFIKSFCREHNINLNLLKEIAISSVVPSFDYNIHDSCIQYLGKVPLFVRSGIKTGVSVSKFKNSHEIGSDLICSAVGAINQYPDTNLLIIDMGTATTVSVINKNKEFLTGVIIPGIKTQLDSLANSAEKLISVEIIKPKNFGPCNTTESIQQGIYYSHLGGINLLVKNLSSTFFNNEKYLVLATGGYSCLFEGSGMFEKHDSDLILKGLVKIIELNQEK